MIQIFGTVCFDKVRVIDEFPKVIGSYTNINSEKMLLGGEASNTFVCLIRWLIEKNESNKDNVKLISAPIKKDANGEMVLQLLEPYKDNIIHTVIIEKDQDNQFLKYSPGADIYVCLKEKERTMFGIGFNEADQLMYEVRENIFNDCLKFGNEHWITLDVNTPKISKEIIKKAIQTKTNLYVMDQEIDSALSELDSSLLNDNHFSQISLIFQSSSDHFGNKNGDKDSFLNMINQWLNSNNGLNKNFLLILTDSKNGFGVGGTIRNYKSGESKYIEPFWFNPIQIPSSKIIDSTGAGDAFRAGLIYSLIYNNNNNNPNLFESLSFASASGGLNCLSYGGNSNTPTLSQILNFITNKQNKYNNINNNNK